MRNLPCFRVILAVGLFMVTLPGLTTVPCTAQQPLATAGETARGISLYQEGKTEEALAALRVAVKRDKTDLVGWHYLGLVLEQTGSAEEARNAHEKAAKLGELLFINRLARTAPVDYLQILESIKPTLNYATTSARKYIELSPKISKSKATEWSERADYLGELSEGPGESVQRFGKLFTSKEVTTKARILSKPEPQYTEKGRQSGTTGTVVLRAILCADGKVRAIVPLKFLSNGLTANCIRVARLIRFIPATIDGRPVSTVIQLEYNFDVF